MPSELHKLIASCATITSVARPCDGEPRTDGGSRPFPTIGLMADEDVVIREAAATAVVRIGPVRSINWWRPCATMNGRSASRPPMHSNRFRDPRAIDPLMVRSKIKTGRSGRRRSGRWNGSVTRGPRPGLIEGAG